MQKDDVIYRRAAIDALKEHRALYCDNTPETFSKLSYVEKSRVDELDTAIATLVNLPSAQPEHKVRFADKDHVWIDGKQYISLPRFQEAVKEASHEPQWIPCSERMPEEHEWLGTTISDKVYVTFKNPKGERFCKHLSFQNGKLSAFDKSTIDAFYKGSKPIAWMPLPEPYGKEDVQDEQT